VAADLVQRGPRTKEALGHVIGIFFHSGASSKPLFVIILEAQGHSSGSPSGQLTDSRQSAGNFFMFLMTKQVRTRKRKEKL
jgi:hypothetical protein